MANLAKCEMARHDTHECEHYCDADHNCRLLNKLDAKGFGLLLAGPCGLTDRLNTLAFRILHEKGRYHSYSGIDEFDIVNDAIIGLVAMLNKKDFPFQSEKHSLNDVIGYCVQSMKHALLKYSTIKKFQGRYCVYFTDCCTVAGPDVSQGAEPDRPGVKTHHYYGKRDCVDQNPYKMEPPCARFASPLGQSLSGAGRGEADSSEDQGGKVFSLSDILSMGGQDNLEEIDRKKLLVKKWREAKSVPEIRRVVRILKYSTLEGGEMEDMNIAQLARGLGLDPGTVRDDLGTWVKWGKEANE
jgi:hypothetical protein